MSKNARHISHGLVWICIAILIVWQLVNMPRYDLNLGWGDGLVGLCAYFPAHYTPEDGLVWLHSELSIVALLLLAVIGIFVLLGNKWFTARFLSIDTKVTGSIRGAILFTFVLFSFAVIASDYWGYWESWMPFRRAIESSGFDPISRNNLDGLLVFFLKFGIAFILLCAAVIFFLTFIRCDSIRFLSSVGGLLLLCFIASLILLNKHLESGYDDPLFARMSGYYTSAVVSGNAMLLTFGFLISDYLVKPIRSQVSQEEFEHA